MRLIRLILVSFLLVSLPCLAVAAEQGFARLNLTEGDVQIRVADTDDWVPAAVNTPLYEGDSVWTPSGGRTEVQLQDGSVIRLDEGSSLSILKVDDKSLQFYLGMGRIYVRTGEQQRWDIQFDLTDSTVKIYDKSRLRIDITARGEEEVSVFKGNAYVESYGNRTKVLKGEMLSVEDSRSEISPVNAPDSWDKWNAQRDSKRARRAGNNSYLPEELVVYEEELSASGEWLEVKEYGRVWRPTVIADADWAPYRSGRWIWRGGDYIWIPFESWGWAPYHYGRWSMLSGFGWCWVPPLPGDVFWAPAFVGWITTPSFVSWVPLAPGEIYYGRGHYGRQSVNVTNVTVNQSTNIYRHTNVSNGVTAVNRNSFISGKGNYKKIAAGNLSGDRIVAGRPEPKLNAKEILMPRIRKIPAAKLPPPNVAKVPVRELKERFPKLDRGAEITSPRLEKRRPEAGQSARQEKPVKVQTQGFPSPADTKGSPLGKPAVQKPRTPQNQEQNSHSADRNLQGPERKRFTAGETAGDIRGVATGSAAASPAVQPATKQESTPPDRRISAEERREAPAESRSQRTKASGRALERKEAVRKALPQERKAKSVWKIKPKEEVQPIKEKK